MEEESVKWETLLRRKQPMIKKIFLFSMIVFLFYSASAQDSCDYNPYQHLRDYYIETYQELIDDYKNNSTCNPDIINQLIQDYYLDTSEIDKKRILEQISRFYCPDLIPSFLENIIQNDTTGYGMLSSIERLAYYNQEQSIPILLEYSSKSKNEDNKIAVAKSFCIMQKYNLAIELLNQFCFDENGNVKGSCIKAYEHAGEVEVVKKYYESFISTLDTMQEDKKITIAYKLVQYGVYVPSRQIFIDAVNNCKNHMKIQTALYGLASIGDEDAFNVIKEQTHNKNLVVANAARFILNFIEKERKAKCK